MLIFLSNRFCILNICKNAVSLYAMFEEYSPKTFRVNLIPKNKIILLKIELFFKTGSIFTL